jgi:hypothetical protein
LALLATTKAGVLCITSASPAQHLAPFRDIARGDATAWLSQMCRWSRRWGEESGLQACYGKRPGNQSFFYGSDSSVLTGCSENARKYGFSISPASPLHHDALSARVTKRQMPLAEALKAARLLH